MLGGTRGVAALRKQDVPHMVEIHCVAHRLELGILDAMKQEKKLHAGCEGYTSGLVQALPLLL